MQRRIQPLSPQLANQIAAGEVVERPASVVKELLENSIDAGATSIELELEQGGSKRIRVRDNGSGIHRDDLPLAISPHATSKIYTQKELEQILSLGFRGEALASIASVSRFTLCSHEQGEESGWQLSHDGKGGMPEITPCALPPGTSVEVRDLFFNIPARRKFLRSERTEFLHVEEIVRRLALSRFDIAFSLLHNNRQILRLRPAIDEQQQQRRIGDVLGKGFMQHAVKLSFEAAGMRLSGWLARPEYSRSQADTQYFYLNGRMVRDKLINHAVRLAHQAVLDAGRHPAFLLYLEVDPRQVDINVHPTKHEVRFRESRLVHDFIQRALLNALEGTKNVPQAPPHPFQEEGDQGSQPITRHASLMGGTPGNPRPARVQVAEQLSFYRQSTKKGGATRGPTDHALPGPLGRAKAILHSRYLLAENGEGPLLLDMQEARVKVLSIRMDEMLDNGEVQTQPLLIPLTLTLKPAWTAHIESALNQLLRLGFVVERLGADSLVVREVPALIRGADVEKLVHEVLGQLVQMEGAPDTSQTPLIALIVRLIVEVVPVTSLTEAERLLRELESLPEQGRGLWRQLPASLLDQWLMGKA